MCTLKITYHEKNVWSILITELCLKRWERTDYKTIAGRITRKQENPNELYNANGDTPNKNMHNTESDHNRPQSFTRRPTRGHARGHRQYGRRGY
jgi:hypothetical protein